MCQDAGFQYIAVIFVQQGRCEASMIGHIFGDLACKSASMSASNGTYRLTGQTVTPPLGFPSSREKQFLYVNRRFVFSQKIVDTISEIFNTIKQVAERKEQFLAEPEGCRQLQNLCYKHPGFLVVLECPASDYCTSSGPDATLIEFHDCDNVVDLIRVAIIQAWNPVVPESLLVSRTRGAPQEGTGNASGKARKSRRIGSATGRQLTKGRTEGGETVLRWGEQMPGAGKFEDNSRRVHHKKDQTISKANRISLVVVPKLTSSHRTVGTDLLQNFPNDMGWSTEPRQQEVHSFSAPNSVVYKGDTAMGLGNEFCSLVDTKERSGRRPQRQSEAMCPGIVSTSDFPEHRTGIDSSQSEGAPISNGQLQSQQHRPCQRSNGTVLGSTEMFCDASRFRTARNQIDEIKCPGIRHERLKPCNPDMQMEDAKPFLQMLGGQKRKSHSTMAQLGGIDCQHDRDIRQCAVCSIVGDDLYANSPKQIAICDTCTMKEFENRDDPTGNSASRKLLGLRSRGEDEGVDACPGIRHPACPTSATVAGQCHEATRQSLSFRRDCDLSRSLPKTTSNEDPQSRAEAAETFMCDSPPLECPKQRRNDSFRHQKVRRFCPGTLHKPKWAFSNSPWLPTTLDIQYSQSTASVAGNWRRRAMSAPPHHKNRHKGFHSNPVCSLYSCPPGAGIGPWAGDKHHGNFSNRGTVSGIKNMALWDGNEQHDRKASWEVDASKSHSARPTDSVEGMSSPPFEVSGTAASPNPTSVPVEGGRCRSYETLKGDGPLEHIGGDPLVHNELRVDSRRIMSPQIGFSCSCHGCNLHEARKIQHCSVIDGAAVTNTLDFGAQVCTTTAGVTACANAAKKLMGRSIGKSVRYTEEVEELSADIVASHVQHARQSDIRPRNRCQIFSTKLRVGDLPLTQTIDTSVMYEDTSLPLTKRDQASPQLPATHVHQEPVSDGYSWHSRPTTEALFDLFVNPCLPPMQEKIMLDISGINQFGPVEHLIPKSISRAAFHDAEILGQVDDKYIFVMCGKTLVAVDQHAADERVRLETMQNKLLAPGIPTSLLQSRQIHPPEAIYLSSSERQVSCPIHLTAKPH